MKKVKTLAIGCAVMLLSFGSSLNAQSSCDSTPDVGQTVGKCQTLSGPWGDLASCSTSNTEGTICYFGGGPAIQE